jgi:hypothetical protein
MFGGVKTQAFNTHCLLLDWSFYVCVYLQIDVVPLCEGKLKIALKVHVNDVVTKAVQSVTCDVFVIGEEPQVVCHFLFQQQ